MAYPDTNVNDTVNKTDPDKDGTGPDTPRVPQRATNLTGLVAQVDEFNKVHEGASLPYRG